MRGLRAAYLIAFFLMSGVAESADWSPPRLLSHSPYPARLQYNFGWAIDVDGRGAVHAAWLELSSPEPAGHGTGRVMYSRSFDDARSWSPPMPLTGAPLPATGHPRVAASGPHVYVSWHGLHDGSGMLKILLLHSPDHGSTWHGPRVVSDTTPETGGAAWPSVKACGDAVHVAWSDARTGMPEIYLRSSPDAAAHWTPVRSVSVPDGRASWVPTVACKGEEVHVAWADERHNVDDASGAPYDCAAANDAGRCREEEYYRRSTDFGATWEPEIRLTHDAGTPRPSWAPSIAVQGDSVHVVFFDHRGDRFQVYHKRSRAGGGAGTWEPETMVSRDDGATIHARPVIAALGPRLHVVWFGLTPSIGIHVLHAASADNGTTFTAPETLTMRPSMGGAHPSVALSPNGSAHVIWYEERGVDQIVHRARRDPRGGPGGTGNGPAWD